ISNEVEAAIIDGAGLTTTAFAVLLTANEGASIQAVAAAASIAAASAGQFGAAVSGGGAQSTNVILTKTTAHIDGSDVTSAGDVVLDASDSSGIAATIVGASGSEADGQVAIAASIGAAFAQN